MPLQLLFKLFYPDITLSLILNTAKQSSIADDEYNEENEEKRMDASINEYHELDYIEQIVIKLFNGSFTNIYIDKCSDRGIDLLGTMLHFYHLKRDEMVINNTNYANHIGVGNDMIKYYKIIHSHQLFNGINKMQRNCDRAI